MVGKAVQQADNVLVLNLLPILADFQVVLKSRPAREQALLHGQDLHRALRLHNLCFAEGLIINGVELEAVFAEIYSCFLGLSIFLSLKLCLSHLKFLF